jgi:flagellar motor switch protein FliG
VSLPDLTGVQKVAVVLMQMNHEASAKVMAHFTETEAEDVAAEIMKMRSVNPDLAEKTMDEFHAIAIKGRVHARGGRDLAARMLEASFGAERAGNLMDRMDSTMAGKSFEFLDTAESAQILGMLDGELPETIALVLAHLRPASASGVMGGLSEVARADVAQAIATMGSATPEAVSIVSDVLKVRAGAVVTPRETIEVVGGVQPLVDIINRSDVATEKALLASLDERDPELAAEVRARMLTFADIVKLEAKHIQQILRGIDVTILATAMKGASEPVLDAIRKNVSERNREILEAEIKNAGPVRMKQVEESRAEVVQAIRALEATGDISVRRSEDDDYVY